MRWKGWDIEGEIHVTMSKRHLFENGSRIAVCGATPKWKHITPSTGEGDNACKRCERIAEKLGIESE